MKPLSLSLKPIAAAVITCTLMACGSPLKPSVDQSHQLLRAGNAQAAYRSLQEKQGAAEPDLLMALELGAIAHYAGDYESSNRYLQQADQMAEAAYTSSVSSSVLDRVSGGLVAKDYQGALFESAFIDYYQALNYLVLADQQPESERRTALDKALVEIRQLHQELELGVLQRGDYQEADETQASEGIGTQLVGLLRQMMGDKLDSRALRYRESAYAHYLAGVLYEKAGAWDDARIAYERSAKAYERGYAEQYHLGKAIVEQAWFDALRMRRQADSQDTRWRSLASQKLTPGRRQALTQFNPKDAQLLVIQHIETQPPKGQLNLMMQLDEESRSLVLLPFPYGTAEERNAQLAWFNMAYADDSPLAMVRNYAMGNLGTAALGAISVRLPIGPLADELDRLGVADILTTGVRVSVPYYPVQAQHWQASALQIDGQALPMLAAESLSQVAMQEQLSHAYDDLLMAVLSELLKQSAMAQTGAGILGSVLVSLSANSDTRHWSSLPSQVRIARVRVPAGTHQVELSSAIQSGKALSARQWQARPGELTVWPLSDFGQESVVVSSPSSNHREVLRSGLSAGGKLFSNTLGSSLEGLGL